MKKIYKNCNIRFARKLTSNFNFDYITEIQKYNFRPGDIISACHGYNTIIRKIVPAWRSFRGIDRVIYDYDLIVYDPGLGITGSCSLINCCSFPTEDNDTILKYLKDFYQYQFDHGNTFWLQDNSIGKYIYESLMAEREILDKNGCLLFIKR